MTTKTGIITYNVTKRGRKHRGVDRNFDAVAMAALVNSGEVQERVKHRDMVGYYGHWPRARFGLNPTEGGLVDGKVVSLEPAFVTTLLEAQPDGTIRHEAEFLDTASGKLAARLYASKAGGFSSAIKTRKAGDKSVPIGFFGFDYVLEPNFTTNRGYQVALDSVTEEELEVMDAVAEYQSQIEATNYLFDSLQAAYDEQSRVMLNLQEENEALMSMLAKTGRKEVVMDGVMAETYGGGESRIHRAADAFLGAGHLPGFEKPVDAKPDEAAEGKKLVRRMLWNR